MWYVVCHHVCIRSHMHAWSCHFHSSSRNPHKFCFLCIWLCFFLSVFCVYVCTVQSFILPTCYMYHPEAQTLLYTLSGLTFYNTLILVLSSSESLFQTTCMLCMVSCHLHYYSQSQYNNLYNINHHSVLCAFLSVSHFPVRARAL